MENGIRSFAERQDSTFKHENVERIVWQPRFSDWYWQNHINRLHPGIPDEKLATFDFKCPDLDRQIFGMEQWEIYDYLGASPRYPGECWPGMFFFYQEANPDADIVEKYIKDDAGNTHHKIITPFGVLTESRRFGSSYPDERILKKREDFKAVLYYIENKCVKCSFNESMWEIFHDVNEGRCVTVASAWRSPYNKCIVELAGTMRTMILMKRYTNDFDEFCNELERINFEIIMPTIMKSDVKYFSQGDNVDCMNNPPPVYKKYQQPYFERIAKECRKAGKFSFAHYDGHLKDILPFLGEDFYPFDGIEAPTILPQGDVSLDELKDALGEGIIVLDGITSTLFTKYYSDNDFVKHVNAVLEAFYPNIVLGVSDEVPPNGLFNRMKMVEKIVEKFKAA
ncbi:MAG: hypothetical protein ACTSU9_04645 [Promethearchaeota archaeon]